MDFFDDKGRILTPDEVVNPGMNRLVGKTPEFQCSRCGRKTTVANKEGRYCLAKRHGVGEGPMCLGIFGAEPRLLKPQEAQIDAMDHLNPEPKRTQTMTERPTCKTCPFYDAELGVPVYSLSYGIPYPPVPNTKPGGCRFQPHSTHQKNPDEWCGEHPGMPGWIAANFDFSTPRYRGHDLWPTEPSSTS